MTMFVGTDIGGTFTDVVGYDAARDRLAFGKRLTTSADLVEAVLQGLDDIAVDVAHVDVLKHGSTQVINALLEREGAKVALLATTGFGDVLEIGRAGRPVAFRLDYRRPPPLVPRTLRFEVDGRIAADGTELVPLDLDGLAEQAERMRTAGVEAVAVAFINAYRNPAHEQRAADFLRDRLPGVYITTATELSRQWFEFERMSTAVANAFVGPRTAAYIDRFEERLAGRHFAGQFQIMASNGGVLSPRRAREQPVALVESGPIGGVIGTAAYGRALGRGRLIAFDMGGTTAKCALVDAGRFDIQPTYYVGGYDYGFPIRTPVLDIVEVGTGGGSIAHLAAGNALRVGPRSAGSLPGPCCFGRGGTEPTVTDANLVLGRISGDKFLGGELALDAAAAAGAIMARVGAPLGFAPSQLDAVAGGILDLANVHMADAIKEITVERGRDARDFELFAFGGGGPLHAVSLARALGIGRVLVPPEPGNFSALGMLLADARLDATHSVVFPLDAEAAARIAAVAAPMQADIGATLARDFAAAGLVFECHAEMRYRGQRSSIAVPVGAAPAGAAGDAEDLRTRFLDAYRRRYGHADAVSPIEIIAVKVTGIAPTPSPDLAKLHRAGTAAAGAAKARPVYAAERRGRLPTPVLDRYALPVGFAAAGPAVIEEFGATTVIGPDDRFEVGDLGELCITLGH
jgi:N-methylhydantoinase A